MRVLVVEDNAFNAFCLRRLLESVIGSVSVTIVNNSQAALLQVNSNVPDLLIIDGDLGAPNDGIHCNGPELAQVLLRKYPDLPLVAWSDSEHMREAFVRVFHQHDKVLNEYNAWTKIICQERISLTMTHYFGDFIGGQNASFFDKQSLAFAR